jgi:hypothetical protein
MMPVSKAAKLAGIFVRMNATRLKSEQETDRAHLQADNLLIETIRILTKGGRYAGIADQIIRTYEDDSFRKWYS